MESIKESISKTKSVLADWNIINKNENNIQIDIDDTSKEMLSESLSEKITDTSDSNTIDKLNDSIKYYENNQHNTIETNEIIKKCHMIDEMFSKLKKMESKIENLEKVVKDNEQNLKQLSNDSLESLNSLNSLNESNENINKNCINYTYPDGLKYLPYTPTFVNSYNRNILFNQYTLSPSTIEILKKMPNADSLTSEDKLSQIENTKTEKGWTFLGIKIL